MPAEEQLICHSQTPRLRALPFEERQRDYLDRDSLFIRVGAKTFIVTVRESGKHRWIAIGRYPDSTLAAARAKIRVQQEARCMEFAYAVASQQGLSNIGRVQIEVAGMKGNVHIAITCVGPAGGQNAIAIVMTMSDDQPSARSRNGQIQTSLARMVSFD